LRRSLQACLLKGGKTHEEGAADECVMGFSCKLHFHVYDVSRETRMEQKARSQYSFETIKQQQSASGSALEGSGMPSYLPFLYIISAALVVRRAEPCAGPGPRVFVGGKGSLSGCQHGL
jgi:hypothetical protein